MSKDNESKTHWREFHPTDYLGAYAFEPGEVKILRIKSAHHGRVLGEKGKSEDCLVVHWHEDDVKPLIVNVTNSRAISKVAKTPYIEGWSGVHVSLYTTEVSAFGETVEAVRIRQTAPVIKKPKLTPDSDKWSGAVKALSSGSTTIPKIRSHYDLSKTDEAIMTEQALAEVK